MSANARLALNAGTVEGWLQNFNDMFQSFGTVKEPLPPSQWYESKVFPAA